MSEDPYVYPGTGVLQNLLNIRDGAELARVERRIVLQRLSEGAPYGGFDLQHLRSIHLHLFQDIYAWAGELRTVEIAKGESHFISRRFIETGIASVHRALETQNYLRGLSTSGFAAAAAQIVGDVNYVHPFREGNGRSQVIYLQQLAEHAGHELRLVRLQPDKWIKASRAAHQGNYAPLRAEIYRSLSDA